MMLRPLSRLLVRGGLSVAIGSLTALCIAGTLYFAATHFRPEKKAMAEAMAKPSGCMPSRCRAKPANGR